MNLQTIFWSIAVICFFVKGIGIQITQLDLVALGFGFVLLGLMV
jgi:hypothetical protein